MALEGRFSSSRKDYDGEVSGYTMRTTPITAANFDAQHTLRVALTGAISGICGGTVQSTVESNVDVISNQPSDDPLDQRESKWLVTYHETADPITTFRIELPCADLNQLDPNDRKHAAIGDAGVVDAFVTAFEAYILGPGGGAVTVDEITHVGRNY